MGFVSVDGDFEVRLQAQIKGLEVGAFQSQGGKVSGD